MAKTYKLTESQIPERRSQSVYGDIIADFIVRGAESMQVTIEGMKLLQGGEATYLVRSKRD